MKNYKKIDWSKLDKDKKTYIQELPIRITVSEINEISGESEYQVEYLREK